jgi:hypothetical protein
MKPRSNSAACSFVAAERTSATMGLPLAGSSHRTSSRRIRRSPTPSVPSRSSSSTSSAGLTLIAIAAVNRPSLLPKK